MKARMSAPQEKAVLYYGSSAHHIEALRLCAGTAGARLVRAYDPALTVGELIKGCPEPEMISDASEECLLIAGFDRLSLDAFLEDIKASGVRIPLKAVLTPHNSGWRLCDLIEELKKEHEYMSGGRK